MKSRIHLLVSANLMLALLRLSALPGALSAEAEAEAEEAKLQGAVAVNSFEDQIATNFFAEEEEEKDDDDIKMKEIIERYSYGRMGGKSGKSIRSCTERLLNDCHHVRRQVRHGYSLPSSGLSSSKLSPGDEYFFREICRDVCDVRIPRSSSVESEKYRDRGSSSKSDKSKDVTVGKIDKSDSDISNAEGASEMEPHKSKAREDAYGGDMMDIDTFDGDEDGVTDVKVLVLIIDNRGRGTAGMTSIKEQQGGKWSNSLALQRACHSAFELNRIVRRSFARRCANSFGYILESFPTVRRFEENEELEEEY